MSRLILNNNLTAPTAPATDKSAFYLDANGIARQIDSNGVISTLASRSQYNWLRNGGLWFAQRQAPGTLTTYSSTAGRAFTADGWAVSNENASAQYIRTDTLTTPQTGLQAQFYGQFTKITNVGKLAVSQVIEGKNTGSLRGRTVRFQITAQAVSTTLSSIWRMALVQLTTSGTVDTLPATVISAWNAGATDPTLGTNLAYIAPKAGVNPENGAVNGNAVDITVLPSVWTTFGGVFDVPLNCKNVMVMLFSNSQIAVADGIRISECSLTDGYETQDWSPEAYSSELVRCQRFLCKSFNIDTAPAQNAGLVGVVRGHVSVAGATANQPIGIRFPGPMRVAPTCTFYNPSAANAFVRNTTAGSDATATAIGGTAGESGLDIFFTGIAAWTVAQAVAVHFLADAEV